MSIINRYVFKTVFNSILLVLMVVCSLGLISEIVDQLDQLRGNYNFTEAITYSLLLVPVNMYNFTPFAALIGSLVGLGSLAASSELVSIRAAGVSLVRIGVAVFRSVLFFILLALFLAEYVVPVAEQYAKHRKDTQLGRSNTALSAKNGLWNRERNEFMHFNSVQANGLLEGITRYRFDESQQLVASSFSRSAIYVGDYWLEEDVVETQLDTKAAKTQDYATRIWRNQLTPELLAILVQDTDNLAISRLYNYIQYLDQQGIDSQRFRLSLWNKLLQPLAVLSLVVVAMSFVFGSQRSMTMGFRIFIGVMIGIFFQMSQKLLGPTSLVYNFPPLIAVAVPVLLCFLLGFYLLWGKR